MKYVVETFDKSKQWEGTLGKGYDSICKAELAILEDVQKEEYSEYYALADEIRFIHVYDYNFLKKINVENFKKICYNNNIRNKKKL